MSDQVIGGAGPALAGHSKDAAAPGVSPAAGARAPAAAAGTSPSAGARESQGAGWAEQVAEFVRDQPYAGMAITGGVCLAIGMLIGRR